MILLYIAVAILIFIAYIAIQGNNEKKMMQDEIELSGCEYNAIYSMSITHVNGLPLSEGTECVLHLGYPNIVTEGTGEIYKISTDRIVDMNIKNSKEIQNSLSGAIGGAILFGAIGAYLGATNTETHNFLLITYRNKEGNEKTVCFDIKDDLKKLKMVYDFVDEFKSNITEKKEIEL